MVKKASLTDISKDPLAEMKKVISQRNDQISSDTEPLRNLNTRLPEKLIKDVKRYCVENDMSIQEFIRKAVEEKLSG